MAAQDIHRFVGAVGSRLDPDAEIAGAEAALHEYALVTPSFSWLGSRWDAVDPEKPAIAATRKQERLGPVVRIGLHCAQENYVVAARIPAGGAAMEICHAVGKDRCVAEARRPIDPDELVFRGFGESGRERLLRYPKYVDREMAGVLEDAQALRKLPGDFQSTSGGFNDTEANELQVNP